MPLLFVGLLWAFMTLRSLAVVPVAGLWLGLGGVVGLAALVWRHRSRVSWRTLLAATLPVLLVFGLTGVAASSNPVLTAQANRFVLLKLTLQATGNQRFGQLPVHISKPAVLHGEATLFASVPPTQCKSGGLEGATISGTFLISPPRERASAANQAALRPNGSFKVECGRGFVVALAAAGASARSKVAQAVDGLNAPLDAKALVLGLTDGDTALLSDQLNAQLKVVSLTHLNAVSGANCAIVVAALFALFAAMRLGRRWRVAGALAGLGLYLLLVGPQPSVIRAAAMAVLVLVAVAWGRKPQSMAVLALGVLLLLWWQPQLATNYGFSLSVLATWGVIQLSPPIQKRLKAAGVPVWLALPVAVALAAQLACLPVLVLLQTKFSLLSTLANVLVEPVVPLITVLGVLGAALAQLWLPLALVPLWLASIPATYLALTAKWFAAQPVTLNWPPGAAGVLLAILLLASISAAFLVKSRLRWLGFLGVAVIAVAFSAAGVSAFASSRTFAAANWFYVSCDVGQGDATVIRSADQIALIDVGRDPAPVNTCLNRLGITHINLLVLTHFDLDHVGGVAGAIGGRQVDQALFTDFTDDRPGAVTTEQTVVRAGIPVRHVYLGQAGNLGNFSWLVLSPHAQGADAVDSNDGSVTMFWHSSAVNLITMADLPATGQMRLAAERSSWWREEYRNQPLVLKVSHHGSADQYPEFLEWLRPAVATVSVGAGNDYGHPTQFTLRELQSIGALILRTDLLGSISLGFSHDSLVWGSTGAG